MALLQSSEPGQTPDPHQRRIAVGIDLGTTHSLVAAVRHGVAECLPDEQGRVLLPVDHPDPCHMHLTGTGLTHLGSAATRNAMHAKADPEMALRATNAKFERRFAYIERTLAGRGSSLEQATLHEMDALWNEAKTKG